MNGLKEIERSNIQKRKSKDKARRIRPCDIEICAYNFEGGESPFTTLYRDEWLRCLHCSHHKPQDLSSF